MRRVVPLLLVLLAAVPQAAFAGHWYRCRYTGKTHATSCCPEREHPADTVSRADCCDLRRTDPGTLDALGPRDAELVVPSVAVAVVSQPLDLGAPEPVRAPITRATAPPGPGAPAYLVFSSLLL